MKLAGKSPPDSETLARLASAGFERFELYLTEELLDERGVEDIVSTCRGVSIETASVHTPHVSVDGGVSRYYELTDEIATALDATMVIDSNPLSTRYMPSVYSDERVDSPAYGYENDPSVSAHYLRVNHLERELPLVLDTAHLHMSEPEYVGFIEEAISDHGRELVPVVHLDNASAVEDWSRPLDEGGVPIGEVVRLLDRLGYEGVVVLEVPDEWQPDALERVRGILSER